MANPKQFVRNKSHRQFLGFYLMNWSTWQLKEKPFHLEVKLKPLWLCLWKQPQDDAGCLYPALLPELPVCPGCAKDTPERLMWPENYSKCWRIPKWNNVHEYSVLSSPNFHSIYCYKEMPCSSSPCSCGRQDRHPTKISHPKSSRKEWWPYCLLAIRFLPSRDHTSCSDLLEGDKLFRKERFPLASLFWKLSLDPSERSLCLNWL